MELDWPPSDISAGGVSGGSGRGGNGKFGSDKATPIVPGWIGPAIRIVKSLRLSRCRAGRAVVVVRLKATLSLNGCMAKCCFVTDAADWRG